MIMDIIKFKPPHLFMFNKNKVQEQLKILFQMISSMKDKQLFKILFSMKSEKKWCKFKMTQERAVLCQLRFKILSESRNLMNLQTRATLDERHLLSVILLEKKLLQEILII